jgi:hypothetical protein
LDLLSSTVHDASILGKPDQCALYDFPLTFSQLPVLSGDIRKLPSQIAGRRNRKPSIKTAKSISSVDGEEVASSSTAVSTGGESPFDPFPVPGTKGRTVRYASGVASSRRKEETQVNKTRYWSEYDNPEESGDEGYFIYVNPEDDDDDDSWIPFRNTFKSLYNRVRKLVSRKDDVPQSVLDPASEPLLAPRVTKDRFFDSSVSEDFSTSSSSDSDDDNDILNPRTRYGTLPVLEPVSAFGFHADNDAIGLLLASIISLFFSATLAVVLLVLTAVGRKRARGEVDLVVLAGTMISLTFGFAGLWGMLRRDAGVLRWVIGLSVFTGVLIIDTLQAGMLFKDVLAVTPPPL